MLHLKQLQWNHHDWQVLLLFPQYILLLYVHPSGILDGGILPVFLTSGYIYRYSWVRFSSPHVPTPKTPPFLFYYLTDQKPHWGMVHVCPNQSIKGEMIHSPIQSDLTDSRTSTWMTSWSFSSGPLQMLGRKPKCLLVLFTLGIFCNVDHK